MSRVFLVILFIVGCLFRWWFANLVSQPFVYDQYQYLGFADGIIKHGFFADYSRLYGYPLIIAPIVGIFGLYNRLPWEVFQIILDTASAFLVFWIAGVIFKATLPRYISLILALFNPFTSAYVGVLLTEIVGIFLATLIFALFLFVIQQKPKRVVFLLLFILGYFVQVKPGFLFFTLFMGAILVGLMVKHGLIKKWLIVIAPAVYLLPFLYSIIANLVTFQQFAILSVDNVFIREFYTSLYIDHILPYPENTYNIWPPQVQQAWGEFSIASGPAQRQEKAQKYFRMGLEVISQAPRKYLALWTKKLWYVWEKHYLFPYKIESTSPVVNGLVFWGNMILLYFGLMGYLVWISKHLTFDFKLFGVVVGLFFPYISLAHIFTTAEERFSLPAYPLVFLFAGLGIWKLGKVIPILLRFAAR